MVDVREQVRRLAGNADVVGALFLCVELGEGGVVKSLARSDGALVVPGLAQRVVGQSTIWPEYSENRGHRGVGVQDGDVEVLVPLRLELVEVDISERIEHGA